MYIGLQLDKSMVIRICVFSDEICMLVFISSLIVTQSRELHGQLIECQRNSTNHVESLKEDLVNCKQNYRVQSNLLDDTSKKLLKLSQLIETCEHNYTAQSSLLEDASKKLLKVSQLIETCEKNYTAQSSLLEDTSKKLLKLSQLIETCKQNYTAQCICNLLEDAFKQLRIYKKQSQR